MYQPAEMESGGLKQAINKNVRCARHPFRGKYEFTVSARPELLAGVSAAPRNSFGNSLLTVVAVVLHTDDYRAGRWLGRLGAPIS